MAYEAGLGDVASEIVDGLARLRQLATQVQGGGNQLAAAIQNAGDYAVRLSNAATGAAAGAKAGLYAPTTAAGQTASLVTPALLVAGAWLFFSSRRRRS